MDETDLATNRTVATRDAAVDTAVEPTDHEMAPAAPEPQPAPTILDPAASPSTATGEVPTATGRLAAPDALDEPDAGPDAVPSVAHIGGHPLHPMIVPLPIGAFVGAFVADVAYARTHDPFWARSARHLTDAAIVTGLLAGALGATDFSGRERTRERPEAWLHAGGNAAVIGLAVAARMLRGRDERAAARGAGLLLSGASAGILAVTGWLGGELSYRHRIGVTRS
jgi:uncharacterized membrane protein